MFIPPIYGIACGDGVWHCFYHTAAVVTWPMTPMDWLLCHNGPAAGFSIATFDSQRVCMYVYIYIHYTEYIVHQTYTHHIHIHIHTHLHIHIHIHTHIYVCVCTHVVCVCVRVVLVCVCVKSTYEFVFEKMAWHNYNAIMPCDMTQRNILKKTTS